jgi:broad specificity phosphatase PhoE
MDIYRHAQSLGSLSRYCQGSQDSPLSDGGRRHADFLHQKRVIPHYDLVISSGLARAIESAWRVTKNKPIIFREFDEMALGDYEGQEREKVAAELRRRGVSRLDWDFEAPNGESVPQVYFRMNRGFNRLREQFKLGNNYSVAIFGHGDSGKIFLAHTNLLSLEEAKQTGNMPFLSRTRLAYDPKTAWFELEEFARVL